MARCVHFNFSGADKSLEEINSVYVDVLNALDFKYSKEKNNNFESTFLGFSEDEVKQEYKSLIDEIGREFGLAIFASVESLLRTDFIIRCNLKRKDKLSKFYRSGYNPTKRIYTYGLSEVVIKGWKEYLPQFATIIDRMSELFQYRNWLAHGRYWILPANLRNMDYMTLYTDCSIFVNAISDKLIVQRTESV